MAETHLTPTPRSPNFRTRSLLLPSSWNTFQTSPRLQQIHWYWPKPIRRRMPTSHDGMSNTMWVIKYYYLLTTLILLHKPADHPKSCNIDSLDHIKSSRRSPPWPTSWNYLNP